MPSKNGDTFKLYHTLLEIVMKKLKILSVLLLITILFCSSFVLPAMALEDPAVTSNAIFLCNADTGAVLYSKNADTQAAPASTTKIMTVLLAIEECQKSDATIKLTDNVTATETMNSDLIEDGSSANLQVGETMTLENLLYCAMLSSGNDACNVIAEYVGGTIDNFVKMMNVRAQELGCTGTNFVNPHGIPADNHYTTAQDLARIALEAEKNELFMTICNTPKYSIPATNMSEERTLSNSNALINAASVYGSSYVYDKAAGIKTGHTEAAGYCLVSTAVKDNIRLLAVVLGGTATTNNGLTTISSFTDSITLYDWAFENFSFQEVLKSSETVGSAPVSMGKGSDTVNLRPQSSVSLLLPNDTDLSQVTVNTTLYSERDGEELVAPISSGQVLGEISVLLNGTEVGKTYLVASGSVDLSRIGYMEAQIHETLSNPLVILVIVILAILFILYFTWVILYRIQRRRHLKAVRQARLARRAREMAAINVSAPTEPTPEMETEETTYAAKDSFLAQLKRRIRDRKEDTSEDTNEGSSEEPDESDVTQTTIKK
jgi:D-alanyl-D-alanine carboxypeptidase (penicillin-binding protein 5/6)